VRRIVKARLVFVPVVVGMALIVIVSVRMTVAVNMVVPMLVVVRLGVRVLVAMLVSMTVPLFRPVAVRVSSVTVLMIVMVVFVSVLVRMLAVLRVVVLVIVVGFAVFLFVTHRLPRFSCASSTLRGEAHEPKLTHKAALLQVARRQRRFGRIRSRWIGSLGFYF
jgi:hypothetical protein